jgi:hypothetical protein
VTREAALERAHQIVRETGKPAVVIRDQKDRWAAACAYDRVPPGWVVRAWITTDGKEFARV